MKILQIYMNISFSVTILQSICKYDPIFFTEVFDLETVKICVGFISILSSVLSKYVLLQWVAQSVKRLTTDWTVRDRIPVETRFFALQTGPGAHAAPCKMGTGSFPGVKCGWGVLLTTHPLLVPRSWKSRAILLLPLWATPGL